MLTPFDVERPNLAYFQGSGTPQPKGSGAPLLNSFGVYLLVRTFFDVERLNSGDNVYRGGACYRMSATVPRECTLH